MTNAPRRITVPAPGDRGYRRRIEAMLGRTATYVTGDGVSVTGVVGYRNAPASTVPVLAITRFDGRYARLHGGDVLRVGA